LPEPSTGGTLAEIGTVGVTCVTHASEAGSSARWCEPLRDYEGSAPRAGCL